MNGSNFLAWTRAILMIIAVAFVLWLYFRIKSATAETLENARTVVSDAIESVDPTNTNNIFSQGANVAISRIAGRDETLGGWIYSIFHSDPVEDMISHNLESNPWNYSQEFTP